MADIKKISEFRSGTYTSQFQYKSFDPNLIHYDWMVDVPELLPLLSEADHLLGSLNAYAEMVPNVDFFIRMHINKEATTSSKIEGTQTNMEEVLMKAEDLDPEKKDDWREVHNYIDAIRHSINKLEEWPISNRLIRDTHKVLMSGVRGERKSPGEYRRSQNWIGATLRDATYIPPHHEQIDALMRDFELFLNDDKLNTPHLIRIGILHYQFETIHPFLDGNGRMGRLLITLYLVNNKLLEKPALYLSDFFEHFRSYYYDNLHRVRTHHDMTQWLKFFLVGVSETAKSSIRTFKEIIKLKKKIEERVLPSISRRQNDASDIVNNLFKYPIIGVKDLMLLSSLNYSAASRMIKDLETLGVLKEFHVIKRARLYVFEEYLEIFSSLPDYRSQHLFDENENV